MCVDRQAVSLGLKLIFFTFFLEYVSLQEWLGNEAGGRGGWKLALEDMNLPSIARSESIWYSPSEGCVSKLSEVSMRKCILPTPSHSLRMDKYQRVSLRGFGDHFIYARYSKCHLLFGDLQIQMHSSKINCKELIFPPPPFFLGFTLLDFAMLKKIYMAASYKKENEKGHLEISCTCPLRSVKKHADHSSSNFPLGRKWWKLLLYKMKDPHTICISPTCTTSLQHWMIHKTTYFYLN